MQGFRQFLIPPKKLSNLKYLQLKCVLIITMIVRQEVVLKADPNIN